MGNTCKKSKVKPHLRKQPIESPEDEEPCIAQAEEMPDVLTTPDFLDPVTFNPEEEEISEAPEEEKSEAPEEEKSEPPEEEKSEPPEKEKSKTPSPQISPASSSKTSTPPLVIFHEVEESTPPTTPPQPMSPHIVPPTFETVQKVPGELSPLEKLHQAAESEHSWKSDASISTLETPRPPPPPPPVRKKTEPREPERKIRRRCCPYRLRIGAALLDWDAIERAIEKMAEGCLLHDHNIKCKVCRFSDFSDTPLLN